MVFSPCEDLTKIPPENCMVGQFVPFLCGARHFFFSGANLLLVELAVSFRGASEGGNL